MAAVRVGITGDASGLNRELKRIRRSVRQFKADVSDAGGGLKGFAAGTKGLVKSLGGVPVVAAAAAGALVGIGVAAFRVADEFDRARKSIAFATGATGEDLAGLVDDARAVFADVPAEFGDVAEVVGIVATAFSDEATPAVEGATKAFVELAVVSGAAIDTTAKQASDLSQMFGLTTAAAETLGDVSVLVQQSYGIDLPSAFNATLRLGPQLQAFGLDAYEALDFVGRLSKEGLNPRKFGALFDAFLNRAIATGRDVRIVWDELTAQIERATTALEANQIAAEAVGGTYADDLVTGVKAGALEFREGGDVVEDADGKLKDATDTALTWGQAWQRAGNAFKEFGYDVAEQAGHVLRHIFSIREALDALPLFNIGLTGRAERGLTGGIEQTILDNIGLPNLGTASGTGESFFTTRDRELAEMYGDAAALHEAYVVERAPGGALDDAQLSALVSDYSAGNRNIDQTLELAVGLANRATGTPVGRAARRFADLLIEEGSGIVAGREVSIARSGRDLPGGEQRLFDALGAQLEHVTDPVLRASIEAERRAISSRSNVDATHTASIERSTENLDTFSSAVGSSARALAQLDTEITRLADGIIVLNDGVQAWQPFDVLDQTQVGNSVITSLGRRATASTATGTTTSGGVRRSAAAQPAPSNWPEGVM